MNFLQAFRINQPDVVFEVFNDEIVIINLASGTYYSLEKSGAEIWQLMRQGLNCPEIVANTAGAYAVTPEELVYPIQQFLTELAQEKLIVPNNAPAPTNFVESAQSIPGSLPTEQRRFTTPSLNKYTDMQDLLLLDPIHEVDAQGWPVKKG